MRQAYTTVLPPPRKEHAAFEFADSLYIFAGFDGKSFLNDMFLYSYSTYQWNKVDIFGVTPSPRRGISFVPYNGEYYIFGGQAFEGNMNDLWSYDPNLRVWHQHTYANTPPLGRYGHCMVVMNDTLFVYGGAEMTGMHKWKTCSFKLDFWMMDMATKTWQFIPVGREIPPISSFGCTVYNSDLYIVLGISKTLASRYINSVYFMQNVPGILQTPVTRRIWRRATFPPSHAPRSGVAAAVFQMYMIWFGGVTSNGYCKYNFSRFTRLVNEYALNFTYFL